MRTRKEQEKLLDDFFHGRIPANYYQDAVNLLVEETDIVGIDKVMEKHWFEGSKLQMLNKEEFKDILDTVHHQINLAVENEIQKPPTKRKLKGIVLNISTVLTKAAAVLFIPLLLSTLFYFNKQENRNEAVKSESYTEVYTPMASRTKFMLSDSTIVWLNAGSSLKYPNSFTGQTRMVTLMGEGYFEVSKNEQAPFIVETDNMNVLALGTSFNIMAYPDEQEVHTTLVTGKVKVENVSTGEWCLLDPADQVVLDVNKNEMTVSQVDTHYYTSWIDGKLVFRNAPLELVAKKLERWYNCTIHIKDAGIRESRYTGNIEMESLNEVLELIKLTTPIKSRFNPETREIWIEPI